MTEDARNLPGEQLRSAMRNWVTGVSIVSSQIREEGQQEHVIRHGMTVNSFVSVSLDPPLVTVTLANATRTLGLVKKSGWFGVTILDQEQAYLADIFAGRVPDGADRFIGVETFALTGNVPLIKGGLASLECKVIYEYPMVNSTLIVGEVQAVWLGEGGDPLLYYNRTYHRLGA
jgi:flavin reductase (DIM6/NTAB) family NADH-FMN oxidoreductase RutF